MRCSASVPRRRCKNPRPFTTALVESLPQNIFRKDLDGRFTFGNRRFCTEIGRTPEQLVGKTDPDFFPPDLAEKYRADDLQVIQSGKSFEVVEVYVTPQGEKLYVQTIKSPVYDAAGRVIGTQGIFWDITEKYRARSTFARPIRNWQPRMPSSSTRCRR